MKNLARKYLTALLLFLYSEFDIAAFVVHVGEVYTSSQQKKQWVFVTDGSIMCGLQSEKLINNLLAICFCSPSVDHASFPPINYNLAGSTVIAMFCLFCYCYFKPSIMDYDSIPPINCKFVTIIIYLLSQYLWLDPSFLPYIRKM